MSKKIDINGFWEIKNNPLTKEGVFMYLGKQIDPKGDKWGLDPDRIYHVYRPKSEIEKDETLKSFEGVPFIDEHEMLGEGCTPTDYKNIAGTIHNIRMKGQMMVGDFKIFSDSIKEQISKGKKQLSLGYRASFEKRPGIFEGKAYDFIQVGIVGNHVALVENGRCGSDVRIFDKSVILDQALEIPQMEINKEELKSVIDGMDEATLAKAKALLDEAVKGEVKDEGEDKKETKDEDPSCKDKCADKDPSDKKEDEKDKCADKDPSENKEVKDEDPKNKDEVKDSAPVLDEAAIRKDATDKFREAIALHDRLVPHIGEFVMDGMFTAQDVAKYGCEKLNLTVNAGSELATLNGFLAGCKESAEKVKTMDGAPSAKVFNFKAIYLAK